MVLLTHDLPTYLDTVRLFDKSGGLIPVAEVMTLENEWLDYLPWVEASDYHVHSHNIRVGLPTVYYRSINAGTPPSTGVMARVLDPMATLETLSQVDDENLKTSGNRDATRWSFDKPHAFALANKLSRDLIFGSPATDPRQILGLAARIGDPAAPNSDNLLTFGGAAGNQTSVYLVGFSDQTVFCPYPKGTVAGLEVEDLQRQLVVTNSSTNAQMVAWTTKFTQRHGLAVSDWRFLARGCNLSLTGLKQQNDGQALTDPTHLFNVMSRMIDRMPTMGGVRLAFLASPTVLSYMRIHGAKITNNVFGFEQGQNQFGMPRARVTFQGIPVLRTETLSTTESVISSVSN